MEQRVEHGTIYLHAVLYFVTLVSGNAEHKVHNIVLYPDKHSWCKTTAIEQVITHPGCEPLTLHNNVCVGACFSYSIPRTLPAAPGDVLPYCDSCQPSSAALHHVTLKCKREGGDGTESESMNKVVEVITNCSCMTCSDAASRRLPPDEADEADADEDADAGDADKEMERDVPQLLSLMQRRPSTSDAAAASSTTSSHISNSSQIIKHRLLSLLTELNSGVEELSEPNQVTLKELLGQVEGEHHQVDDATLQGLVEKVQKEEHISIDINQLKHILHKFESSEKQKLAADHNLNAHRHQHVHGPHHSLVYGQNVHYDRIHSGMVLTPTLDVESHHLKPALAGSELSYHDNLVQAESEHEQTSEKSRDDHDVKI